MRGLEMDCPLVVGVFLDRARDLYGTRELVTLRGSGIHRQTYAETAERVARLQSALIELGVKTGDVVATLCSNDSRHLEIWFAVMGLGAAIHTLNPRLSASDLQYVASDGGARLLFVDSVCLEASRAIDDALNRIVVGDSKMGTGGQRGDLDYESLIETHNAVDPAPPDERDAALICHTSGTTSKPKGVVMSHRAIFIHTLVHGNADVHGISERDVVMPIVQMFHAAAWGIPFAATFAGAKQVFAGRSTDVHTLLSLIVNEGVTYTAGVPYVFQQIHQRQELDSLKGLRRICMGGYPAPTPLLDALDRIGVEVQQGYGMTEAGPLIARTRLKKEYIGDAAGGNQIVRTKSLPVPGMKIRIVDPDGNDVPKDGVTAGEVQIRAPWVAGSYLGDAAPKREWLETGDIASWDSDGYICIVDRSKDVIKSGGEWISSIDLERAIRGCDGVAEVAVVAAKDDTWGERPWAFVIAEAENAVDTAAIEAVLLGEFASWQVPDRFVVVDSLPRSSVGKIDKVKLREMTDPQAR